jgi:hypothetical protein
MSSALARSASPAREWAMASKTQAPGDAGLDEALAETFPASDPIASSAANRHVHDVMPVSPRPAAVRKPRRTARRRRP